MKTIIPSSKDTNYNINVTALIDSNFQNKVQLIKALLPIESEFNKNQVNLKKLKDD